MYSHVAKVFKQTNLKIISYIIDSNRIKKILNTPSGMIELPLIIPNI